MPSRQAEITWQTKQAVSQLLAMVGETQRKKVQVVKVVLREHRPNKWSCQAYMNFLLSACIRIHGLRTTQELLAELMEIGHSVNTVSVNTLMKHCNSEECLMLWFLMPQWRVVPDAITFQGIIHAFTKEHNLEAAETWWSHMLDMNIKPNTTTRLDLLVGNIQAGRLDRVAFFLDALLQPDFEPFPWLVDKLVWIWAGVSHMAELRTAGELLVLIQDQKRGNAQHFSVIIEAFAKAGLKGKGLDKLLNMHKFGIFPDALLYSHLLLTLCKTHPSCPSQLLLAEPWTI